MVHVQGRKSNIQLTRAAIVNGDLVADLVHLVTLGTAPAATDPYSLRSQRHYAGGVPIWGFVPDQDHDIAKTRLLVDVWASRPSFPGAGFLPATRPNVRHALSLDGCAALGRVPAEWAFRDGAAPPVLFHFRFWFTNVDFGTPGPVVVRGGQTYRAEQC